MVDPVSDAVPEPRENPYLTGHESAERAYLQAWESGRLAHAWLICGLRGIGKATLAYRMARYALAYGGAGAARPSTLTMAAEHPVFRRIAAQGHSDFRAVERPWDAKQGKRKTQIPVEEIRGVGGFLAMTPAEGGWRAVVVDAADEMNVNAANALLKVLEEPPRRSLLFLVAHQPERLLPTIRSRCRRLEVKPLARTQVSALAGRYRPDLDGPAVAALAVLADGSIGRALELAEEGGVTLFRDLLAVLKDAPQMNTGRLHALGDQALKGDNFRTLAGLLAWWLARIVAAGARGVALEEIVPGERELAQRLLAGATPATWSEVWDSVTALARRTEGLNLDRKRSLMVMLWTIAQTAKMSAVA